MNSNIGLFILCINQHIWRSTDCRLLSDASLKETQVLAVATGVAFLSFLHRSNSVSLTTSLPALFTHPRPCFSAAPQPGVPHAACCLWHPIYVNVIFINRFASLKHAACHFCVISNNNKAVEWILHWVEAGIALITFKATSGDCWNHFPWKWPQNTWNSCWFLSLFTR